MLPRSILGVALLLVVATLAGCATGGPPRSTGSGRPANLSCLNDSSPGPDRPLFFLFCVQSP